MEKFNLIGDIQEISQPKFLQNGAEVQTIVLAYTYTQGAYSRAMSAPISFYSSKGLDKLHELNLGVGDKISVYFLPSGRKNKDFWNASLDGDHYTVKMIEKASKVIEF